MEVQSITEALLSHPDVLVGLKSDEGSSVMRLWGLAPRIINPLGLSVHNRTVAP